jgi:hypothetical protein
MLRTSKGATQRDLQTRPKIIIKLTEPQMGSIRMKEFALEASKIIGIKLNSKKNLNLKKRNA